MNKKLILLPIAAACCIGLASAVSFANKLRLNVVATDECVKHHGNHYAAKEPTASTSGWKEFWACCECGHQYLEEVDGVWTEGNELTMLGGVGPEHIAYVGPTEKQNISLYKDQFVLSVGDKATIDFIVPTEGMGVYGKLSYSSNSTNVSVSDNGIITANTLGDAVISVSGPLINTKDINVSVVDTTRDLGFDFVTKDEVFEYDKVVHNKEELNYAMCIAEMNHFLYETIEVELTEEIADIEFEFYHEMRDTVPWYVWADRIIPGIEETCYDVLPIGNYTLIVNFGYACDFETYPAEETSPINGHETTHLTNIMTEIRHYEIAHKDEKDRRNDTFLDFPMYEKNTNGYMDVYNSEELWWSITNGFIPRFPLDHSSAEQVFEECKDILRQEISNDMTDEEKMLAIYDYIGNNIRYDYEALECDYWLLNTAWYLEGALFEKRCVCDAFSRLYALLCNMEGLTVDRGCGANPEGGGHAWNYAKVSDTWYLTCSTWAHAHMSKESASSHVPFIDEITTPYVEFTNYNTFLADLNYMVDEKGYTLDYKDTIRTTHTETASISFLDVFKFNNRTSDLRFISEEKVTAFAEAAYATGATRFYVTYYQDSNKYFSSKILSALRNAGYSFGKDDYTGFKLSGIDYSYFVFDGAI